MYYLIAMGIATSVFISGIGVASRADFDKRDYDYGMMRVSFSLAGSGIALAGLSTFVYFALRINELPASERKPIESAYWNLTWTFIFGLLVLYVSTFASACLMFGRLGWTNVFGVLLLGVAFFWLLSISLYHAPLSVELMRAEIMMKYGNNDAVKKTGARRFVDAVTGKV